MKKLFYIILLFSVTSCHLEQDQLVYDEFKTILYNSKSWQKVIKENKDIDRTELIRMFFRFNESTSKTNSDVYFHQNYYNLSDENINRLKLRQILDNKNILCRKFYSCDSSIYFPLKELYQIEAKIYNELLKMSKIIESKNPKLRKYEISN